MSILFNILTSLNSAPEVPEVKPLTLRNVGTSSGNVSITKSGSPTVDGLQYRMEGEKSWLPYTIYTEITVNPNEAVQFQNTNEMLSETSSTYAQFVIPSETKFNAEGNIQSFLNYSDFVSDYCFCYLFKQCYGLVDASQLELPVTTLATGCYYGMFRDCTNLVNAPALPATTLASYCYDMMFRDCTSLVNAPELPATTLADHCYQQMFYQCSSLKEIKVHFTAYNGTVLSPLNFWVSRVSATGTFYKPTALPEEFGASKIPTGWTVVNIDAPEITVETPVTLTGKQNTAITEIQLNATLSNGGQAEFSSTDLPTGLTLSNTGLISGIPTISGEGSSTITVSYTGSQSKTIILNWNIEPAASDKTYVYTVSGAGTTSVNGDYWDSGEVYDGIPVYTNGTCEMFGTQMNFHGITDQPGYRGEAMILYHAPSFTSSWTINEGASPAPTVTEYNQSSGDSGGESNPIAMTCMSCGTTENLNYVCPVCGSLMCDVCTDYGMVRACLNGECSGDLVYRDDSGGGDNGNDSENGDDSSADNGYLVTGSGAGDYVNGTYLPDGEKNGLPIYKCNTGAKMECKYAVNNGVQLEERAWEIYDSTGGLAYYQNDAKGNMPESGGWYRALAPDPVPTVTKL